MDQNRYRQYEEKEISLKELILILWDGKFLIAMTTAIAILLSGVYTFFVLEPTYDASTVLLVANASQKPVSPSTELGSIDTLVETMSGNVPQTITTYAEQIKTSEMMKRTLTSLNISPDDVTVEGLKKMIQIENIQDTNLLRITVTAKHPDMAADLANTLANEFSIFIAEMNSQRLAKSSEFLKEKMDEEKVKLDMALQDLKEFLSQPRGVTELKNEINAKMSLLNSYKTQLEQLTYNYEKDLLNNEVKTKLKNSKLKKTTELLAQVPYSNATTNSLIGNTILSKAAEESGADVQDLANLKLENEEINPTYQSLEQSQAELSIDVETLTQERENIQYTYQTTVEKLTESIERLRGEMDSLQAELAEKEYQKRLLEKNVSRAESSYDTFVKSYEETRVAESADIGKSTILINSVAVANAQPVGPRKTLNLAIGLVLGAMLGVFIAFFRAYWQSEPTTEKA